MTIYTIGHSSRTGPDLIALLAEQGVRHVVDVRRYPASRRHPQFSRARLEESLAQVGIAYEHELDLAGRREPLEESPNAGWLNDGFRGFADYMDTDAFRSAIERLRRTAAAVRTAILCSEAVPWNCHRRLIADALVARSATVLHILRPGRTARHELSAHARVLSEFRIVYPPAEDRKMAG